MSALVSAPQERVCGKPQPSVSAGWGRKPPHSEPRRGDAVPGDVRRRAHIVGRIGKFRRIGEGRALPARLIYKLGGLLILRLLIG